MSQRQFVSNVNLSAIACKHMAQGLPASSAVMHTSPASFVATIYKQLAERLSTVAGYHCRPHRLALSRCRASAACSSLAEGVPELLSSPMLPLEAGLMPPAGLAVSGVLSSPPYWLSGWDWPGATKLAMPAICCLSAAPADAPGMPIAKLPACTSYPSFCSLRLVVPKFLVIGSFIQCSAACAWSYRNWWQLALSCKPGIHATSRRYFLLLGSANPVEAIQAFKMASTPSKLLMPWACLSPNDLPADGPAFGPASTQPSAAVPQFAQ